MDDKIVYMRVPPAVLDAVDDVVKSGLYSNRAEILRELLRNGMKNLLYHSRGGYCMDLKKIVDCCHDDECKFYQNCKIFTQ